MRQAALVEQSTDSSSRAVQLLRRHPLISFFVSLRNLVDVRDRVPDRLGRCRHHRHRHPELLGPIVAGFVMTAVMGGPTGVRRLLRRFVMWRVRAAWYLYALVAMPALYLIAVALVPGALGSFKVPSLAMSLLYPVLFSSSSSSTAAAGGTGLARPSRCPVCRRAGGALLGTVILGIHVGRLARTAVLHEDVCSCERPVSAFRA